VTKLYNAMTVREMQHTFPTIPWLTYFNSILPEYVHISEDEVIIVAVPSFIKGLEKLMEETPRRCVILGQTATDCEPQQCRKSVVLSVSQGSCKLRDEPRGRSQRQLPK